MNQAPIKRIAIVGPECTGKTSLSLALANHYQTKWVPEFARHYIDQLDREYTQDDLLKIAIGQLQSEDSLAQQSKNILICDTNLIVIKVWSEFNYGSCDPEIIKLMHQQQYDLHLLTQIDIPWEEDPQREHPHEREKLYAIYTSELEKMKACYVEISGDMNARTAAAIQAIDALFQ